MATQVIMPQMGDTIAEGTITKWLVEVGSPVEREQPLFEISTDKVDAEIPSPGTGVLRQILCPAGRTVPVNSIVAWITADMLEPVPAVEAHASFNLQPSAPSRGTVQDTETLIETLRLTRSEERELRHLVGLGPSGESRFDRLFYSSLTGGQAALAFIALISCLVALSYLAWDFSNRFKPLTEVLNAFLLPLLALSALLGQQRSKRLILKLYRALEEERASRRTEGASPQERSEARG